MTTVFTFILIPLILTGILHMLMVKTELWRRLAIPISRKYFGENKTWRGILVVPLVNALLSVFINSGLQLMTPHKALLYGAILGLVYVISELPNSWYKRRKGIKPGTKPRENAWLFTLLDKLDSGLGITIASALIFELTFTQVLILLAISSLVHFIFSALLVKVSLKTSL